jgi:hypothetical protein
VRLLLGIDTRFVRRLQRRARVVWRALLIELVVLVLVAFGLLARLSESAEVATSALVGMPHPSRQGGDSGPRHRVPLARSARPTAAMPRSPQPAKAEGEAPLTASN